jgi:hypothetical protein
MLQERLLQIARPLGESLHGQHRCAADLARGHEARCGLPAVDPDRARAAVAGLAADLRAGQAEIVAEDVG